MDTLSEVLDNIRSSGALIGQDLLRVPWSVRYEVAGSITIGAMLRGDAWIHQDGRDPMPLAAKDLVILTGSGIGHITSDSSGGTAPLCVIGPTGVRSCVDVEPGQGVDAGCRVEGVDLGADCTSRLEADHVMLAGSYPTSGRIADRLLRSLPPVIVVPREHRRSRTLELLEAELAGSEPGQQAVLDRLLDLVLIGGLRDWFALPDVAAPAWYGAAEDPIVGPALSALHTAPARAWTVDSLAREAQVSRATFARRFTEVMGEPPISYLAGWRLCLAADLLQDGDGTLESIARQVGYSSSFALSAAFTREFGIRPTHYREGARV